MSTVMIPAFTGRVAVVGDIMLDRYWSGPCSRISPEAPVPVVRITKHEDRAGGAANVALNVAALGSKCTLIGIIGKDEAGSRLEQLVKSKAVDTSFVLDDNPTITKLRILSRNQQLLRADFEEASHTEAAAAVNAAAAAIVNQADAVICSDYGKGALAQVQAIIQAANAAGKPVLIDPKGTDFSRYRGASLLTPNLSEFEAVAGTAVSEEDLAARGFKLIKNFDLKALLITRSEDGMTLLQPGRAPINLKAQAREVYDVTGAGDTVIGTLGACLASGLDLISACEIANRAAGIVVGKLGTSTVTPQELKDACQEHNPDSGIVSEDELVKICAGLKQQHKRIVMTNGCFDLLHKGHVDYLKRARALGDVLIVAVNSDASVSRLKGSSRPIVSLNDRMEVLEALACVDYVTAFNEDTPARLIGRVLPDVLVKGGDYKPDEIAGHEAVIANGGEVIVLPFVPGRSTSGMIDRIVHQH